MPTIKCPNCAIEIDADAEVCPYCGYEFPTKPLWMKVMAWVMILLLIAWLVF